jgi:RNA polymerase sporulation-specific sigma factor
MARHKVELTGVNTAKIKVLKNKEMMELFKKYQAGDSNAREELVNGNLKLVLSILRKYTGRTENMDDLFQVGCIGLLKSIDNFDLKHGVRFSTYAVPMILGEVKRFLRDDQTMRVSRSLKDLSYAISRVREEINSTTNREPSLSEIAEKLGISEWQVLEATDAMKVPISLYQPIYNDGGDTIYLFDQISDKKQDKDLDVNLAIKRAIKKLKNREQFILQERFMIGKTQTEISEELGISQAQVSRLEKNAIKQVKKMID